MVDRETWIVLNDLASAVVLAEASDKDALDELRDLVKKLVMTMNDPEERQWRVRALKWRQDLSSIRHGDITNREVALACLVKKISDFQQAFQAMALPDSLDPSAELLDGTFQGPPACKIEQPQWVDENVLQEFLTNQKHVLQDIENTILNLENGDQRSSVLSGLIHTLKGEAGILGLNDLQAVCHALEDLLEQVQDLTGFTDVLLHVKDWISDALEAYSRQRKPEPRARALEAYLQIAIQSSRQTHGCDTEPQEIQRGSNSTDTIEESVIPESLLHPNEETLEEFRDFIEESDEGLDRADQLLIKIEKHGADNTSVHGLFRIFHSMKGMAAFLKLQGIANLAHGTEAVLNLVRSGDVQLSGATLDKVFDATALLRKLLTDGVSSISSLASNRTLRRIEPVLQGLRNSIGSSGDFEIVNEDIYRVMNTEERSDFPMSPDTDSDLSQNAGKPAAALKIRETVKVDVDRLDRLVEMVGELVIMESMITNAPEMQQAASPRLQGLMGQLGRITSELQDIGMNMRMVPVRGLFQKMARLVRDLSKKSARDVRFVMTGEGTEIDRSIVEGIADPLMHMIRNAVGHGIEDPGERQRLGKPTQGVVKLTARTEGGSIVIELSDDGRGINRKDVMKQALKLGLVDHDAELTDSDVLNLIFSPGMSTASMVTEISGRGVGMDVVKRSISKLRGRIAISSTAEHGTTFRLILPLTLAIIDGMVVSLGQERYIMPTLSIIESVQVTRKMVSTVLGKGELVTLRGESLPLVRLARLFDVPDAVEDPCQGLVIVLEGVGRRIALLADDVLMQQQVVIKSLGTGLGSSRLLSGAAIMSDGSVGLILNVDELTTLPNQSRESAAEAAYAFGDRQSLAKQIDDLRSGPA